MVSLQVSSLGIQMQEMILEKDNGIHKSFMERVRAPTTNRYGGVYVGFQKGNHPSRARLSAKLRGFRADTGIKSLLPFQVEAVLNIVFRPEQMLISKSILRGYNDDTLVTARGMNILKSPFDDIGMMVINDLFTGSGKTLTTMLGVIAFAHGRHIEILDREPFLVREQLRGNWGTRIEMSQSLGMSSMYPKYTHAIVVMCAKHLVSQWKSACASALHILGIEGVSVLENPLPKSEGFTREGLKIVILHSVNNLTRLDLKFVPAIVVDEFTVKSVSNILTKSVDLLPMHGRLVLVSADAGNVRNIICGSHRRSLLRNLVGWDDINNSSDSRVALVAALPLIGASILETKDRFMVGDFMIEQLKKVVYEKYTVRYTPSFASRLFGNNFEMSAVTGSRLMTEKFGIVLEGTKTIGQMLEVVSDKVDAMFATDKESRILAPLIQLRNNISKFVGEKDDCPICFEEYEMASGASLINPCWHIICDKCLRKLIAAKHDRCPICRGAMEGHTTAVIGDENAASRHDCYSQESRVEVVQSLSLLENISAVVKPTTGLEKACVDTLRCIREDVGDRPYKIVMIVPDEHFFTKFTVDVREEMDESQVEIIEFKTIGNKRKHVTGKSISEQIASFTTDEGPRIKILFTTEGKTDSLTGLDFPTVDCIISLGDGNSLQRLGRLTRLPRVVDEASASKMVRYICLEPVD